MSGEKRSAGQRRRPGRERLRRLAARALGAAALVAGPLGIADAWAQFSLVTVAQDGGLANGDSSSGPISADGRFVVFQSKATNLVLNDTNASSDVFVRDRQTNTTTRVSVTSAGAEAIGGSGVGDMTPDGRFVVFDSYAALVAGDTNVCDTPTEATTCGDIYVHDRQTSTTTRISVSSSGTQGDGHSSGPSISADGRYVVFTSAATNLVAGDTNGRLDVFQHDRQTNTTTRVSANLDGTQMSQDAAAAILSDNGEVIVYRGSATPDQVSDPLTCRQAITTCLALYQWVRSTNATTLFSNQLPASPSTLRMTSMVAQAITADGRLVVVEQSGHLEFGTPGKNGRTRALLYDRVANRTTDYGLSGGFMLPSFGILSISSDGRTLAYKLTPSRLFSWYDRVANVLEVVTFTAINERYAATSLSFSGDSRFAAFSTLGAVLPGDTDEFLDIYVYDRDAGDGDGMPGAWETEFGLNPSTPADAAADPDADGLTNLQEFQRGSHPMGTHTRYFAEGAANAFFATRLAALNPGNTEAHVVFRYLGQEGQISSAQMKLAPKSRTTVNLTGALLGIDNSFSTVVESDQPVVVDRTMTWGFGTQWGGHAETSIAAPSTTWHLAEGATHGAFDLFYLFQNPNPTEALVTVTYLRLDPATPVVKTYSVAPNTRKTIWVDDEGPELAAVDVGASITSDVPIVVERAMYSTRPGQSAFAAGHGGAGVTAPAPKWFLAEGATGQFFDMYVLIANPNATASDVKVTYLLGSGAAPFSKTLTVGARTRKTLSVKDEDPRLADTAVSVIVETTNNQPLVVERAMWWPRDQWYEAHLSAGATTTGTRWALAEGEVADDVTENGRWETYILIANTSAAAGTATVTLVRESGEPIVRTIDLPANSRVNVPVSSFFTPSSVVENRRFGAIVESSGVEIVVERAMYQTVDGVTWSIGTAALATKLP